MHSKKTVFESLGLPKEPLFLAPLAGVSDIPFRVVCSERGADLTYVEMLSGVALVYNSQRTFEMLARHASETKLGVQVTAKDAETMAKAVEILNRFPFETIDINMGCPVRKVVNNGCGAAITRDPENVHAITKAAVGATDKPLSVKYRLGWDRNSLNYLEVADAIESAGAAWLTIHGRTRSDDYSREVDLDAIGQIKRSVKIPVLGNGNIFCRSDAEMMRTVSHVDGIMVSRGALGNPWIFNEIKGAQKDLSLSDWYSCVLRHIELQKEIHGDGLRGLITMRKHLLWYLKGWPMVKKYRESLMEQQSFAEVLKHLDEFVEEVQKQGLTTRTPGHSEAGPDRFLWNPTPEMNREADAAAYE